MSQEIYHTSFARLRSLFNQRSRRSAFSAKDPEEYAVWKAGLRRTLARITGLDQLGSCDPSPRLLESRSLPGHRRDRVLLQTEPGIYMPLYVLVPEGLSKGERRPCVLAPHGHGSAGKEGVAGVRDNPAVAANLERYQADYGLQLVNEGYVVLCPDARGSGERRESRMQGTEADQVLGSSCNDLNFAALSLGLSLTGLWVWDLMRLLDYAAGLDFCDASRLGCAGFSGGGLQALWLAALDERVRATVVSGYFHGYRDSLLQNNLCGCNFVPHLWEHADMGDLGALVAPRPLCIETGDQDPLNGPRMVANAEEQVAVTRRAYALLGAGDALEFHVYQGGHRWYGREALKFLRRQLA